MDCSTFAFDLHVLGTPPALILSQDQTLMLNSLTQLFQGRDLRRDYPVGQMQLFNARPIMFGSALFNPLFDHGSPPAFVVRTDNFEGRVCGAMR